MQDSLTNSEDIGIGITLAHCTQNPCETHVDNLGTVLFVGPFNPEFGGGEVPTQNYSVQIPSSFQPGPAVLSLEHAALVGVSLLPSYRPY